MYSNLRITPDQKGVTVVNDNLFTSTADYTFKASLLVNGVPQWQEDYFFDVAPESTHELVIPLAPGRIRCRQRRSNPGRQPCAH